MGVGGNLDHEADHDQREHNYEIITEDIAAGSSAGKAAAHVKITAAVVNAGGATAHLEVTTTGENAG